MSLVIRLELVNSIIVSIAVKCLWTWIRFEYFNASNTFSSHQHALIRWPRSQRTNSNRSNSIDEPGTTESWYVEGCVHIGLLIYIELAIYLASLFCFLLLSFCIACHRRQHDSGDFSTGTREADEFEISQPWYACNSDHLLGTFFSRWILIFNFSFASLFDRLCRFGDRREGLRWYHSH